jgi:hypothetical protein
MEACLDANKVEDVRKAHGLIITFLGTSLFAILLIRILNHKTTLILLMEMKYQSLILDCACKKKIGSKQEIYY